MLLICKLGNALVKAKIAPAVRYISSYQIQHTPKAPAERPAKNSKEGDRTLLWSLQVWEKFYATNSSLLWS